jgi:hypothetical protein
MISGKCSTGNNYAKGKHDPDFDIILSYEEKIRKTIESCDRLNGFMIFHSLGGGTGSGSFAKLSDKLLEDYPD